ncbi:MAG: DUF2846 domain-containing protein [Castellaniella sp.]|uniref:DUF2846 domain-containing protein n=1 Tax=Castellaniella sp. TaxID=1955812 RepID=UPI003A867C2B
MFRKAVLAIFVASILGGCASVPMESKEASAQAKRFEVPADGNAGLYVYRDSIVGQALKKDIWVNDDCLGESASGVFFYRQLPGDEKYTISTESEFSPNSLSLLLERGKNYFVRQYIKLGVFVGGADLEVVEPEKAKTNISKLELAKSGTCSGPLKDPADSNASDSKKPA